MAQVSVAVKRSGTAQAVYTRNGIVQAVDIRSARQVSVQLFRTGPVGRKPAHKWVGTAISFECSDGSFGEAVDLKGGDGEGIGNFTGDPLVHYILARS